jgi:hypothetical protein
LLLAAFEGPRIILQVHHNQGAQRQQHSSSKDARGYSADDGGSSSADNDCDGGSGADTCQRNPEGKAWDVFWEGCDLQVSRGKCHVVRMLI